MTIKIAAKTERYWNSIGIFPQALSKRGRVNDFRRDAARNIETLGHGNLLLLCTLAGISAKPDAEDSSLANALVRNSDLDTLIHLREFLKRRIEAVESVYEKRIPSKEKRRSLALMKEYSRSSQESLKPLTKAVLLLARNERLLLEVFYFDLWKSRASAYEYGSAEELPASFARSFSAGRNELCKRMGKVTGLRVNALEPYKLSDGTTVLVMLREYPPTVKRDFHQTYNVHYQCGLMVAGFDSTLGRMHLKTSNKRLAKAFEEFLASDLSITPTLLKDELFGAFDIQYARKALVGEYPPGSGIEILEVKYGRTALPDSVAMALNARDFCPSICPALNILAENGILDIHGPGDVDQMKLSFRGKIATLTRETTPGGAIRLTFDNAGWDQSVREDFEQAFLQTFGFPVNKRLNPGLIYMGSSGIFSHLLTIRTEGEVEDYHHDCFASLVNEHGILRRTPIEMRGCRSNFCGMNLKGISDPQQTSCRACGKELETWSLDAIERDSSAIAAFLGPVLSPTEWKLASEPRQFERNEYFSLGPPATLADGDDNEICVVVADRLTRSSLKAFERYSRPILVAQATTLSKSVYVDEFGIGRLNIGHALAASEVPEERQRLEDDCKAMLQKLRITHQERLNKAARHSYEALTGDRSTLTGAKYETEIFNIVRVLFPDSHQLGREGRAEPDGFVSFYDYKNAEAVEQPKMWNWIYDAKLSELAGGYRLGRDEQRKAKEYIEKFRRNRKVLLGNRRIQASAFISGNISQGKMKGMATYLFGPDGLSKPSQEVKILFVDEQYLLRFYEWMSENQSEWRQRRIYVAELIISQFEKAPSQGYRHLQEPDAENLLKELMKLQVVTGRITREVLQSSLEEVSI